MVMESSSIVPWQSPIHQSLCEGPPRTLQQRILKPHAGAERNLSCPAIYVENESKLGGFPFNMALDSYWHRLRCDRKLPCHNCTHRGFAETCHYPHGRSSKSSSSQPLAPQVLGPTVRDRVKQLEDQVVMLMDALNDATKSGRTSAPITEHPATTSSYPGTSSAQALGVSEVALPDAAGHIEWSNSSVTYVGNAHWRALLESVCMPATLLGHTMIDAAQIPGFQDMIGDISQVPKEAQTAKPQMPGPLSGIVQRVDRAEIMAAIPPKDTVDILIQESFINTDNECSEFSVDPPLTSILADW